MSTNERTTAKYVPITTSSAATATTAVLNSYEDAINRCTHGYDAALFGFWEKMALIQWAKAYPVQPTATHKQDAKQFLRLRAHHLGCKNPCSIEMTRYIQAVPPNLSSRKDLLYWMHEFFNNINKRMGWPCISLAEFMQVHIYTQPTVDNMLPIYKDWQRRKNGTQS